jgi:hypothetical protein
VSPEEVQVEREVTSDWLVQSDGPYVVALDPASLTTCAPRAWPARW